jgi:hypothetical protein
VIALLAVAAPERAMGVRKAGSTELDDGPVAAVAGALVASATRTEKTTKTADRALFTLIPTSAGGEGSGS